MATPSTALPEARDLYTRLYTGRVANAAEVANQLKALITQYDLEPARIVSDSRLNEKQLAARIDQFVKEMPQKHEMIVGYARRIYAGLDDTYWTPATVSVGHIRSALGDIGKDLAVLDASGTKSADAIDAELKRVVASDELRRAKDMFGYLQQSPLPRGFGDAPQMAKHIATSLAHAGVGVDALGTTPDAMASLVEKREGERFVSLYQSLEKKDRAGYSNLEVARQEACRLSATYGFSPALAGDTKTPPAIQCSAPTRSTAPAR